jgi:TRAP-type C4-dicarboxylate transport system substrate-binding protein
MLIFNRLLASLKPHIASTLFSFVITLGLLSIIPPDALAKGPDYLFKVASLAPDGSIWAKRFEEFAREVREKSNGAIGFKIYPGGIMGDDRAMYRKMKIGQLHGGGFTMTGIGEVVPDFRVMGIPFLFNSYEEIDAIKNELRPSFDKAFADKGLMLLAMSEVGFIYTMSTAPITTLEDLRKCKSWVPEGDPISNIFFAAAGVSPIPLSIPDVLSSLQTGFIDTTYNSYYGAIVLQWFTRAKFITDIPFAYAYGGLILDLKKFKDLPKEYADLLVSAADVNFAKLLTDTRKSNADALQVLQANGITIVPVTEETRNELEALREKAVLSMKGTAFSTEIYDRTMRSLLALRHKVQ